MQTLADFWPLAGFFFDGPADDPAAREKWLDDDGRGALARGPRGAGGAGRLRRAAIEPALGSGRAAQREAQDVYQPIRVAIAGTPVSPGIFETLAVLGEDESLAPDRRRSEI